MVQKVQHQEQHKYINITITANIINNRKQITIYICFNFKSYISE